TLGVPARLSDVIAVSVSFTARPINVASAVFACVRLVMLPDSTASACMPSLERRCSNVESAPQNFDAHVDGATVLPPVLGAVATSNSAPRVAMANERFTDRNVAAPDQQPRTAASSMS